MKYFVFLMVVIGIFVRLYRLEESSHFAFDESRDLVNMHQIWVEKKLTLVGPISEDRSHANSSLTYYMLLPFAALFDFEPIGPVIGSVFWGLLTSILMYLVLKRINPEFSKYAAIISAIWIPLVITSRWAWNPNNLTFWIFLALYLDKYKHWIFRFLVGLFMGLAFHHHNLAIIPIFIWTIYKRNLFVALGVACSFLPFVIFDLRHAPGIFLVKMIGYNKGSFEQNLLDLIQKIPTMINYYFNFLFQNKWFAVLGIFLTFIVAIKELFYKNANRIWFVLWFFSLVPLVLYKNNNHYFLPGIPFFIIWLFCLRQGLLKILSLAIIFLLILGSIFSISKVWRVPDWEGNLRIVKLATNQIYEQINNQNIKNANIAVLASPDIYTNGNKYRNMLLVKGVRLKSYDDFSTSDNLFVVTTSDVETLRKDPAAEIMYFRNGPVRGEWKIENTGWKVIQFNKY